ncbi:hypothetical protein I79_015936 [Cricetulus griseus]|uniref:Uncharacterized protein n=1 Tax=Cricetulus griseus TaxID=10029 RepID=G3HY11_CRIGR|nr:hypothetical protein I79_015936 [Cricetulus griseus]
MARDKALRYVGPLRFSVSQRKQKQLPPWLAGWLAVYLLAGKSISDSPARSLSVQHLPRADLLGKILP